MFLLNSYLIWWFSAISWPFWFFFVTRNQPGSQANSRYSSERRRLRTERKFSWQACQVTSHPKWPRTTANEAQKISYRSHPRCHPYTIPQTVEVGHTTGVYVPYSFRIVVWVLLRPTRTDPVKVLWDGTYGFSSLSEKTRKYNHLQMSLQRQHFLHSYFKTLSVGPVGVWTSDLPLSKPALSQLS